MTKFNDLNCILLVDDDVPTNFIHRKIIQKANVEAHVQTATSGREALDFLTYSGNFVDSEGIPRPGIIFLDINMPGMNGWEFMDAYRELDARQKAQAVVIMLTTSLNADDRERAEQDKDIVTFINKPLKPEVVLELANHYFSKN